MWIAPVIVGLGAALLGGCGLFDGKKGKEITPDPETKPAPPPMPSPKPPRHPRDLFSKCFGPARDLEVVVENPGRGLCGRFSPAFGPVAKSPFTPTACFPTDPKCDLGPGVRFGFPFHLVDTANFASFPVEFYLLPRGSAVRTETFKRDWEFSYLLDGGLYDDCSLFLQMWQGVKSVTSSGVSISRNLGGFEMPMYSPRKDGTTCAAEPDFSNEKLLHIDAPLCAVFPAPSGPPPSTVTATEVKAGTDCDNRMGTSGPLKVMVNLK